MNTLRLVPLVGALAIALAACSSGGAASPAPASPSSPPSVAPSPSDLAPPDGSVTDPGGGVPGDPGGGAKQVSIWPNAKDPHDAVVTAIIPALNGRRLAVQLEWWSGVEPCNVLAGIDVVRNGNAFLLTVKEGVGDPNAMCIEIAELHATIVDLGELEPGTYTISAKGEALPVEVVIP
jgi:hypothetical protein